MQNPAGVDSGSVATCGIHQFETNLSARNETDQNAERSDSKKCQLLSSNISRK